jgi:16S rRNA processing protein RimM
MVRRPFGLGGEVLVEPLTDRPERIAAGLRVHVKGATRTVESSKAVAQGIVLRLSDCSFATAETLRGEYLSVGPDDVAQLDEGSYYHWQLIGLQVTTVGGVQLGIVDDVLEYPANDVYVVRDGERETLVPAVTAVVKRIDIDTRMMVVDLPPEIEAP